MKIRIDRTVIKQLGCGKLTFAFALAALFQLRDCLSADPNDSARSHAIAWRFKTSREVRDAVTIDKAGSVYVSSLDGVLYALTTSGTERWQFKAGKMAAGVCFDRDGVLLSAETLFALDPNGAVRWSFTPPERNTSRAAVAEDGTVYVSSSANLYAIGAQGDLKWKVPLLGRAPTTAPVVGCDGVVYVDSYKQGSTISRVLAITPNGRRKYEFEAETLFRSSPALDDDRTLYLVGGPSTLFAIDSNGRLKWSFRGGNLSDTPVIDGDHTIYVASLDHFLYAINRDGSLKWKFRAENALVCSPVIHDNGVVSFAAGSELCSLDRDGRLVAKFEMGPGWRCAGAPLVANNRLYAGGIDGFLYAINGFGSTSRSVWPMKRHDQEASGRIECND
jgi:outer membrane protein assembly factor BamB